MMTCNPSIYKAFSQISVFRMERTDLNKLISIFPVSKKSCNSYDERKEITCLLHLANG